MKKSSDLFDIIDSIEIKNQSGSRFLNSLDDKLNSFYDNDLDSKIISAMLDNFGDE